MTEEIIENNNTNESTDTDYIEVINNLKTNTVSKDTYQKLKDENKRLLDSLVNGQQVEAPNTPKVSNDQLRKDLFTRNLSNLEFVEKTLQLRQNILDEKGEDIFAPDGPQFSFSDDDRRDAQRVADALQSCVDIADGNSAIFTNELQRILKDTPLPNRRSR